MHKLPAPVAIVAGMIALAWLLFNYVRSDIDDDARLRFERQAADAKHVIERRLRSYVDVTYGLKALFASHAPVSRAEFHRYVKSLNLAENYPGFVQLNYAHHLTGDEAPAFERAVRRDTGMQAEGYPGFAIKPPGQRAEYHVLVYIEPMEGNEFAFGLDIRMAGASGRNMDHLRETDGVISSGRLLNVGKEKSVGLAMRLPVHRLGAPTQTAEQRRAAFIGSVGAGYNVRKLMTGVLDRTTMVAMRYRLFDAGSAYGVARRENLSLLFDSAQDAPGPPQDDFAVPHERGPTFHTILPLELAGRSWELHFSSPRSAFVSRTDEWLPWLVLAGSLLAATLFLGVLYSFASSRERAVVLASDITRHLRESEASLAHAQSLARLGSWTLDPSTGSMTWSPETFRILGLDAGSIAPAAEAFLAWLGEEERSEFWRAVERGLCTGAPASLEFALRCPGHDGRWVHLLLQPAQGGLRGTIMDVTERKQALEAQRAAAGQIRELLRRLVSVQEAERRRFSADLHDLIGQSLSVLGIGLATIRAAQSAPPSQRAEAAFGDMEQVLRETMAAVRETMADLRPPLLDDYGLLAALGWHARQLEGRTGLQVAIAGDKLEPRPRAEVELALFRIAQEALTNVAKHAGATRARLALAKTAGRILLVIEDDGRGLQAANDPGRTSWGMVVMRERAMAVGGTVRVESPGEGTRITVEVAA